MAVINSSYTFVALKNGGTVTDISQFLVSLSLTRGFRSPHALVADGGTCDIVLDNGSGGGTGNTHQYFSPNYNVSNPYQSILVPRNQVYVTTGGAYFPGGGGGNLVFTGYIESITPTSSSTPPLRTTIKCVDLVGLLKSTRLNMPLMRNRTGDQLVAAIINNALNAPAKQGTIVFTGTPANNDAISVTDADGNVVYLKFVTGATSTPGAVWIAGSRLNAAINYVAALNQYEGLNTSYGALVPPNYLFAQVVDNVPSAGNTTVYITSLIRGDVGTAFTIGASGASFTVTNPVSVGNYPAAGTNYDVGTQVFPYAGHNWAKNQTTALSAIQEVTESENGRFWVSQSGVPVWRNNQFIFKELTFPSGYYIVAGPKFQASVASSEIYNDIKATITPPALLSPGVVAKSTSAVSVAGNSSKTVHLQFVDPTTGKSCGAQNLILPLVAGTDWVANERKDGLGVDYTTTYPGHILFKYVIGGAGLDLTITNTATGTLYLNTLQVRGTAVVQYNSLVMETSDATSIATYGYNDLRVNMSMSTNDEYALSFAGYLLSRYKAPAFRVTQIMYAPAYWDQSAFSGAGAYIGGDFDRGEQHDIETVLELTDYVTVIYHEFYRVIGITLQASLTSITLSFIVEKLDDVTYWLLGNATYGVLGTNTRLAI